MANMAKSQDENMLSAAKWAERFGVSAAKVKKAIEKLEIEPDMKKGRCAYYSEESAMKIKDKLQ